MKGGFVWMVGVALLMVGAGCSGDGGGSTEPPPPGSVAGRVGAGTTDVSGASVTLSGGSIGTTTTNAQGRYRFDNLSAGTYSVALAVPIGFELSAGEAQSKQTSVQAGQTATVNWELSEEDENGGAENEVAAQGDSFVPETIQIPVGGTVTWRGVSGDHTVTPDDPDQAGVWQGFGLGQGQERSHTFDTPGAYEYHCIPHQAVGMRGTIVVGD